MNSEYQLFRIFGPVFVIIMEGNVLKISISFFRMDDMKAARPAQKSKTDRRTYSGA